MKTRTTNHLQKVEDKLREQDLVLDEYESDREKHVTDNGETLSASTQALLDQLKPPKASEADELNQSRTKVILCSRTHSQLTQLVNELRKIRLPSAILLEENEEVIKHAPLGSRKTLCINPKVSRLTSNAAINERCLELQKPGTSKDQQCQFFPSKHSSEDRERIGVFKDNTIAQIQDIEDIAELGRRMKMCPYYASRSAIPGAEVLTLPYPLLLQKSAREALGVSIRDNVVIIDEAHNLTSAIADTLSVTVPLSHLELAQSQLLGYCQRFKNKLKGKNRVYIAQIIRLVKACVLRLQQAAVSKKFEQSLLAHELLDGVGVDQIQPYKLVRYINESKLIFKVEGYAEMIDEHVQVQRSTTVKHSRPKGVLAEFQTLLIALMNPASEGKFFISRDPEELVLKYSLLDPQAHFEEVVKEARAVILAGGTMSPMSDWADQLFPYLPEEEIKTFSFGHIVDKSNIMVEPLTKGPNGVDFDFTWSNRRSDKMILELAVLIERICTIVPDGVVVFFPSYDYLAFVTFLWTRKAQDKSPFERLSMLKQVFQESKDVSVDVLLKDFSTALDTGKGALMLAVVGGKLSEGINFSDKLGRAVVCVGLPYPNIKSVEWQAKIDYIERLKHKKSLGDGQSEQESKLKAQAARREYADNTTMRAVNQSIGRAIRHKNDYAAIFLVDRRYATSRIQRKLPAWLTKSISTDVSLWETVEESCKAFFREKDLERFQ